MTLLNVLLPLPSLPIFLAVTPGRRPLRNPLRLIGSRTAVNIPGIDGIWTVPACSQSTLQAPAKLTLYPTELFFQDRQGSINPGHVRFRGSPGGQERGQENRMEGDTQGQDTTHGKRKFMSAGSEEDSRSNRVGMGLCSFLYCPRTRSLVRTETVSLLFTAVPRTCGGWGWGLLGLRRFRPVQ